MKLLLASSFLHPRGGDTTLLFDAWQGWEARGVEVIPFGMRHPDNVNTRFEVHYPSWHAPRSAQGLARLGAAAASVWSQDAARSLDRLLRIVKPEAAHLHHLHRHLTPSILPVLRAHNVRTVWTLHDHELVCPTGLRYRDGAPCSACLGGDYRNAVRGRCKDGDLAASAAVALEKAVHRARGVSGMVDVLVSPSHSLAAGLREAGIAGRVEVVANPLSELAAPPLGHDVLYAGRLTAEKGVALLPTLAAALPTVRFHVVGSGPVVLRGPPNLLLHGAVPRSEVFARMAEAAVVLVPSRWPENQPYAVLEAQRAGRAVLASAVGGIPELITDGVDGRLLPPDPPGAWAAALEAVLADRPALTAMGVAGRARVQREHDMDAWFTRMGRLLWS